MLRSPYFPNYTIKILLFVAACLLNSPLFAYKSDPCADVKGEWHGTYTEFSKNSCNRCTYEAVAEGSIYHKMIRLIIKTSKGKSNTDTMVCKDNSFVSEGTCDDGDVVMNGGARGSVYGGYFHIRYAYEEIILQKQKSS